MILSPYQGIAEPYWEQSVRFYHHIQPTVIFEDGPAVSILQLSTLRCVFSPFRKGGGGIENLWLKLVP